MAQTATHSRGGWKPKHIIVWYSNPHCHTELTLELCLCLSEIGKLFSLQSVKIFNTLNKNSEFLYLENVSYNNPIVLPDCQEHVNSRSPTVLSNWNSNICNMQMRSDVFKPRRESVSLIPLPSKCHTFMSHRFKWWSCESLMEIP